MTNINIDLLRRMRRQQKLKIQDVARLLKKDPSTIWRYENGQTQIKADTLFRLAELYGVQVTDLYLGEGE